MNKNVVVSDGSKFNEIARETNERLLSWIRESFGEKTKESVVGELEKGDFKIDRHVSRNGNMLCIVTGLFLDGELYGLPFVSGVISDGKEDAYYTDVALLLMCLKVDCKKENVIKIIDEFVKNIA